MKSESYVPLRGVFETTLKCNLNCRHCGSRAGNARSDELSIDEIRQLFADLGQMGMKWISLSGGEPMTRKDWPQVIEAVRSAGIYAGMITNAVFLDKEAIATAKAKGLSGIGLSIDGGHARTHDFIRGRIGHFDRLTEAMDDCVAQGMPWAALTHINAKNLNELNDIHDLIVDKGAYAWQIQLGTDMGNMSDNRDMLISPTQLIEVERILGEIAQRSPIKVHPSDSVGYFGPYERLLRQASGKPHWTGCGAGKTVIGIESNGNIKGCLSIMAGYNDKSDDFVEGNIRKTPIADIWNNEGAFSYTRNWSIEDLQGECKTCKHVQICKGGCTAKKVASGNGVDNPMCVFRELSKQKSTRKSVAQTAAAVAIASVLGAGVSACDDVSDDPNDTDSKQHDKDTNSDSSDTSDTDTLLQPEYGMPYDTNATDADYGMPQDTDSTAQVDYGMPYDTSATDADYGMPQDTDTNNMLDYGMPFDTEK